VDHGEDRIPCFTYVAGPHVKKAAEEEAGLQTIAFTYEEIARSLVPALASFNEPVGDGSARATWLLIRAARPRATVFLCGRGADEVLGGYRLSQDRFRLSALRLLCRLPIPFLDDAMRHFTNGDESEHRRKLALAHSRPAFAPVAARYLIHRPLPSCTLAGLLG